MAPRGAQPQLAKLLALLGALLPGSGSAQTLVHPLEAILPKGGSMQVNCSTTCDQPITLGLETTLTKKEVARGDKWKIFELSNVTEDSSPMCFTTCGDSQTTASANLTVYRFPESVELTSLPPWQPVGENLTLRCQVVGGAPQDHLTLVLLRGEEELSRQPALGEPAEVTVTVLARREDHGANFSCRTELDLRRQGLGLFENSSTSRQLRTFALPVTDPLLTNPRTLEAGEASTVKCSLEGVFPVWEAQVHMALGDQRLSPVITSRGSMLSATAVVRADNDEEGPQQLACAIILGNQSRETRETVTIYSFPAPNLTLSELVVSEWTVVTVVCEAHAAAVVTLSGTPALVPAPIPTPPWRAKFHLNATPEDNGRSFFCSAALEVAGQALYKNQTQQLHVLYGPRLDEGDCPGNWTWQEGSEQTLKCQAWGNPLPKLECHRKGDGFLLPIGDLRPVKREHAGTYLCQAMSPRGEVTRQVVVNVLYSQVNWGIIITAAAIVILLLSAAGTAGYLYNRQRKIRKYKLQKAQEALKMNTPP
ncbi:intercellular adhesion molecule 1 [Orycteropus afer afer]|uniref:Intercellular adhesion molecule 1 n=1 Tax=Orycteropus afer afer TaxID=1230840 RepID=A0A8B7AVX8_ORYAF|nr:intercellular adhesion molecule 1 [Orycteropus afer afer]